MAKRATSIPVNYMADGFDTGIVIEQMSFDDLSVLREADESHRHDRHSFFLLEKGTVYIEIDFEKYTIKAPSVIYLHPDQVHRTTKSKNVTVSSWAINNENLDSNYLKLLQDITPAKPLSLKKEMFSILSEAVALCIKFEKRKSDKLYHSLLKNSCNALVAMVVSKYLEQEKTTGKLSRFETITKAFKELLERNYTTSKRPADYARQLNISVPYLNECIKNITGHPVSYHIQQRVMLEAKRLLYHSNKSVKEIASELGYDDYPYFSRLFTKLNGITAIAFRNKNLE